MATMSSHKLFALLLCMPIPSVLAFHSNHGGACANRPLKGSGGCNRVLLSSQIESGRRNHAILAAATSDGFERSKKSKRVSKGKAKTTNKSEAQNKSKSMSTTKSNKNNAKIKSKGLVKKKLPSIKLSSKSKTKSKTSSIKSAPKKKNAETTLDPGTLYIQFSRVFQRHVVYQNNTDLDDSGNINATPQVIQSYEFLDDATSQYPGVRILAPKDLPFPPPSCSISFDDDEPGRRGKRAREEDECETSLAGMGATSLCELEYPLENVNQVSGWTPVNDGRTDSLGYRYDQSEDAIQTLMKLVLTPEADQWMAELNLPRHYNRLTEKRVAMRGLTSERIRENHDRLLKMLGGEVLEMERLDVEFVLFNFPQLCLYDGEELKEMLRFLVSPLPPVEYEDVYLVADKDVDGSSVDWPKLAAKGYGSGLTKQQAAEIVRMMPEVLALYYEDSQKPSMRYMRDKMHLTITPDWLDVTMAVIKETLEGTPTSDTFFFSFVAFHGVSWRQIRILVASLKLWRNCDLDPSWQILQYDHVRSQFKRYEMDFLRKRLQIAPSELQKMIKTHPRLSSYSACFKMNPILNKLQNSFGLSSSDVKMLSFRMPSLIGMSTEAIDGKLQFFFDTAGMTREQCRTAVLKQPSLIQYSIEASLKPKLDFFLTELGIDQSMISRIIINAPALMGYSLTDSLRPKVIFIMKECSLNQFQVGNLIATSPSLLTLSVKGKIEPMLSRISDLLGIGSTVEIGQLVMTAPRMLHQSIPSLNGKYDLLAELLQSEEKAAMILRKNPSLLQWNLNAFKNRLGQYTESDLISSLEPSKSGRQKLISQPQSDLKWDDAVIASPESNFESINGIYPDISLAAKKMGVSKSVLTKAVKNSECIDGCFFSKITTHVPKNQSVKELSANYKTISIIVQGSVFPSDSMDSPRGQSKTGGVCLKILNNGDEDFAIIEKEFKASAASCFAIIPNPFPSKTDILVIFPLTNASRNRCELYSLWASLRVIETLINRRRSQGDIRKYNIKIHSSSSYALKIVANRERLLKLGSSFTYNKELLTSLGMNEAYSNVDILHPLVRSFSRINGQEEPPQSRNVKIDGTSLEFVHANDVVQADEPNLKDMLERQATFAAKWQTKSVRL